MTGMTGCLHWLLKVTIDLSPDLKYVTAMLEFLKGDGWTQKSVSTQAAFSGCQDQTSTICSLFRDPIS